MQAAKKAVENIKETAANIGASAKSGLEKTKATIQEKNEIMNAQDQTQKEMATQKKVEKINQAEMEKQQARENNAAAKQSALMGHMTQDHYANPGPGTATNKTTWPESETTVYPNTGPGTQTGPRLDNAVHSNTGSWIGHETATYPTDDYGQMGVNQTTAMPGHGPGHGGFTKDALGSLPNETNTGVDTTAQTTLSGANFS